MTCWNRRYDAPPSTHAHAAGTVHCFVFVIGALFLTDLSLVAVSKSAVLYGVLRSRTRSPTWKHYAAWSDAGAPGRLPAATATPLHGWPTRLAQTELDVHGRVLTARIRIWARCELAVSWAVVQIGNCKHRLTCVHSVQDLYTQYLRIDIKARFR